MSEAERAALQAEVAALREENARLRSARGLHGAEPAVDAALFAGESEMHARVRAHDWAGTPVGPVAQWPQSLRSTVKTLLASRYPMVLIWGPAFTQFYNDAYSRLIGDKHPAALGIDIRVTLAEGWDTLGPIIAHVMETGSASWLPALPLLLERSGYREESYFSVSHAPAEDDAGRIVGMLAVCSEVTEQVIGGRRLGLLRDLAIRAAEPRSVEAACRDVAAAIAEHPLDVPFALLYLRDGQALRLQGTVGVDDSAAGPPVIDRKAAPESPWPLERAAAGESTLVEGVERTLDVPGGPWGDPVRSALVLPIASSGQAAPLGVMVLGVSPNRALDEGYRSFHDLLAGQVSATLRNALAHEEERKRAEALVEVDRAKTRFFSNVSHEFRTPLTLMLGPLEDMLARAEGEVTTSREEVELLQRNAMRLLKLVNSLLDFSRLEAGRAQATYQPTDLAQLTGDLASAFRAAIERAGLRLSVDCPPLPEPAYVDREMWEKIVLNLLSNAFKYTFAGEIRVDLRAKGDHIELSVEDTGTGIPAEEMPHLFERFRRVEGARGRTHEGTGIGLALVQELAQLHGGSVRAESATGQGSVFTVTVPLGATHLPPERVRAGRETVVAETHTAAYAAEAFGSVFAVPVPSARTAAPRTSADHTPAKGRVLLADDNADMRGYIGRLLEGDFEVEAVADGEEALRAAQAHPPDLVLTDVMMPVLDGFGLLRALRADPRTRTVPVILLSARAGEESRVEGLQAGADDYLVKPFSARELLARVGSQVELARLRREMAHQEEERRAERRVGLAVRDSEERLRLIIDSVPAVIAYIDRDGRYQNMNRPYEEFFHVSRDEVTGRHVREVLGEAYYEATRARLEQALRGEPVRFETVAPVRDDYRHLTASYTPDLDADGTVRGIVVLATDVTERKRTEEALRAVNATLTAIIQASPLAIVALTAGGEVTLWNPAAERMFGWTASEALGGPLPFIPEDRREEHRAMRARDLQGESFTGHEVRRERRDGSPVDISVSTAPLRDATAAVTGIMSLYVDVTERKRAEAALRESEARFRTLAEALPQIVFTATPDGSIDYGNTHAVAYSGLSVEQVSGTGWFAALHADDLGPSAERWLSSMRTGEVFETEYRVRRASDGSYRWHLARAVPLRDSDGRVLKWLGAAVDIDDRRRAEEDLRLTNERLTRANRELEEFAYVASHDLQEPLRNVGIYSQMMRRRYGGKLDDEADLYLGYLVEGAQRMGQLVRDLLAYSQAGRAEDDPAPEIADADQALEAALEGLRHAVDESQATVVRGALPRLPVRAAHLQQLFQNLIGNALKYRSDERQPVISVAAERDDGQWVFSVADNGIGIEPQYHERIFGIFKRLHGRGRYAGTGIGLAICQRIVERYGGRIWVESALGQGTTFRFTLPAS